MNIDDFIWLPDIIEKLETKHHVTLDEVEEVFFNRPQWHFVELGRRDGEDIYAAMGQTDAGRYLIAFFIQKPNHIALIISARDMDTKERKKYEKR
ncbi:MAG: BrnT family toxin [Candidatus Sumerlaeota bacterium]|nr:BrnT family toxin [Candidatus Sumerlaeota bacterium]